jgi:REP element-mobilizing transposase RayT
MNIKYDPQIHRRDSIRLKKYDYSQEGAYFVTICTKEKECIFGNIKDEVVRLSELGKIVKKEWENIPTRFPKVELDEFIIMPNHIHGIIIISEVGATLAVAHFMARDARHNFTKKVGASPTPTIGYIVGSFKSICVNRWLNYIAGNNLDIVGKFWQRNYYEHIIRKEKELTEIREYIINNPLKWELDKENPNNGRCPN